MKKIAAVVLVASLALLGAGCQGNKTRVAEGTVLGGLVGAAGGAAIGSLSGNAGAGAGIGAAIGAGGGALVGSQIDQPGQGQAVQPAAVVSQGKLTMQQIIDLSKQGNGDQVIIDKIKATGSKFVLADADVQSLKDQGVSPKVIDAMQGK